MVKKYRLVEMFTSFVFRHTSCYEITHDIKNDLLLTACISKHLYF